MADISRPVGRPVANRLELGIERLIMWSRWLQAPLYIGRVFVLGVVVVKFPFKLWELVQRALIVEATWCWRCCRWSTSSWSPTSSSW